MCYATVETSYKSKFFSFKSETQFSLDVLFLFISFLLFVCCLVVFLGLHLAYGSSQARGQIEAVAAGLCHSIGGSELHLQPPP